MGEILSEGGFAASPTSGPVSPLRIDAVSFLGTAVFVGEEPTGLQ
jgi:hypothetical protein